MENIFLEKLEITNIQNKSINELFLEPSNLKQLTYTIYSTVLTSEDEKMYNTIYIHVVGDSKKWIQSNYIKDYDEIEDYSIALNYLNSRYKKYIIDKLKLYNNKIEYIDQSYKNLIQNQNLDNDIYYDFDFRKKKSLNREKMLYKRNIDMKDYNADNKYSSKTNIRATSYSKIKNEIPDWLKY